MNQRILTLGASSTAAILVVALVFLPGYGIAGSLTGITNTQQPSKANTVLPLTSNSGSILDKLNLVMPSAFTPIDPQKAYADGAVQMNLVAVEKTIAFPKQVTSGDGCGTTASTAYSCLPGQIIAYTFNGTIPAPVIRVTEGQTVAVTVWTPSTNTDQHGADNHASITSATNFLPPDPSKGQHSITYAFVATQPGVWEYHCEGHVNDLAEHVFRGMHGMVIVDPASGYTGYSTKDASGNPISVGPNAKEIALDFSEYYLTNTNKNNGDFDWQAMYDHRVTYAHINGIPFGYQILANAGLLNPSLGNLPSSNNAEPLKFNAGEHVRFFVLNTGDYATNFHIVGEILDRVIQGGQPQYGVQTFNLGGSNGAVIDVTFTTPGAFVIVNHDYSQLFKGQVATILVCGPGGLCPSAGVNAYNPPNPSNAVPPLGSQSVSQNTTSWTFGQPLVGWQWDVTGKSLPSNQKPVVNGGTVDKNFCADNSAFC